jgi:hypothetical protein
MTVQLGAYAEGRREADAELLRYYSAALDEIYALRAALASEARIIEAHLMQAAAKYGTRGRAYSTDRHYDRKAALRSAGAGECLGRSQFEREVDRSTPKRGQA